MKEKYITPTAETFCVEPPSLLQHSVRSFKDGGKQSFGDTDEDEEEEGKSGSRIWNQ